MIGATVIDDELKAEHDILRSAMGNEVDKWLSAKFIEALDPRDAMAAPKNNPRGEA